MTDNQNATNGPASIALSICIPTYNRGARLAETLGGLLSQIERDDPTYRVEVVVSDNASTDETQDVLLTLARRHGSRLRFSRSQTNRGYSPNAVQAVRLAQGEFIALAGDDDLFVEGAVEKMVQAVTRGFDVVILNSLPGTHRRLPPSLEVSGALECIERFGVFHLTFIGNALMRRGAFLQNFSEEILGSAYVHSAVLLRALATAPALFLNFATVNPDDRLRTWRAQQPLYSGVDMARLITDEVFTRHPAPRRLIWRCYWMLIKSIPRVIVGVKRKRIVTQPGNRYSDASLHNVLQCYRASRVFQLLATALWASTHVIPTAALRERRELSP